jgi:hypothetical protein
MARKPQPSANTQAKEPRLARRGLKDAKGLPKEVVRSSTTPRIRRPPRYPFTAARDALKRFVACLERACDGLDEHHHLIWLYPLDVADHVEALRRGQELLAQLVALADKADHGADGRADDGVSPEDLREFAELAAEAWPMPDGQAPTPMGAATTKKQAKRRTRKAK